MAWYDKVFSQYGKKEVTPEMVRDKEQSFAPIDINDAMMTTAVGGLMHTVMNYGENGGTDIQKIEQWRSLAKCPEIAWAVNEVCNDAIITDYESYPCQLTIDEENKLPEKIKQTLVDEFREVLRVMNFKRTGAELFQQWYVDGRVYYHGILDPNNVKGGLVGVRWIDPRFMKRVVETEEVKDKNGFIVKNIKDDYYVYNENRSHRASVGISAISAYGGLTQALKVNPECIAYASSGIYQENEDGTSFSLSYLNSALKSYNTLSSLEQAMTIYRLARAPERRVFYVDVGNLPKDKADQYLSNVMARFKRKLTFNSETGTVSSENNEMGIMDDFWLPRKDGGRGTEVTTLTSGQSWSDMNDLEWFQKKVLRGLNIPFGRYQSENMFSSGRSMEITREEVKFAKFISSLRTKYSQALIQLLKIHVIAKNVMSVDEFEQYMGDLNVKWKTDAYWDELLSNEMWQTRMNLYQTFQPVIGVYYSHEWAQKNIMQMTQDEIDNERKKIEEEKKSGFYEADNQME